MIIELPDEIAEPLRTHAQAKGISEASYVRRAVEHALAADDSYLPEGKRDARPIWEVIQDIMKDVPDEEFAKLPKDGAAEHDHYLYGHPKRNQ